MIAGPRFFLQTPLLYVARIWGSVPLLYPVSQHIPEMQHSQPALSTLTLVVLATAGWVREMYAWDAAVALHKEEVKVRTEHYPYSTTIVQPPFDVSLGQACMTHYTWGALYHEGVPSKGGKQVRGCDIRCRLSMCVGCV